MGRTAPRARPGRWRSIGRVDDATQLLQSLIRFDTVNPPGNERAAIEHLERLLTDAGFQCELLAAVPERPNLVATPETGNPERDGPTLCYLGHVDTVLADAQRVDARPLVGRDRRGLPVGAWLARHEVAGGRRGGRRRRRWRAKAGGPRAASC